MKICPIMSKTAMTSGLRAGLNYEPCVGSRCALWTTERTMIRAHDGYGWCALSGEHGSAFPDPAAKQEATG